MYKELAGSLRIEDELLVCSARVSMDEANALRIKSLLDEKIDWDYLIDSARRHALTPLLYRHMSTLRPEAVPPEVMAGLKSHFLSNAQRNLFLTAELVRLLKLFRAAGITAVPYRGPVLAEAVYGNLAHREFADLDIMVRETDIPGAKELLLSNGFTSPYRLSPRQESAHIKNDSQYQFIGDSGGVLLELHWNVTPPYFSHHFDITPLWQRLKKTTLGGETPYGFSPEDTLLMLCVHGAKHRFERLGWITDISELVKTNKDLDWEEIFENMQTVATGRMVLLGLFLAGVLGGAPLPEKVHARVSADTTIDALTEFVLERLFSDSDGPSEAIERWLFQLRIRNRLGDKLGYSLRLAASPHAEDFSAIRLPPVLFPLYYALRPLRLAGKYARIMLKRLI